MFSSYFHEKFIHLIVDVSQSSCLSTIFKFLTSRTVKDAQDLRLSLKCHLIRRQIAFDHLLLTYFDSMTTDQSLNDLVANHDAGKKINELTS